MSKNDKYKDMLAILRDSNQGLDDETLKKIALALTSKQLKVGIGILLGGDIAESYEDAKGLILYNFLKRIDKSKGISLPDGRVKADLVYSAKDVIRDYRSAERKNNMIPLEYAEDVPISDLSAEDRMIQQDKISEALAKISQEDSCLLESQKLFVKEVLDVGREEYIRRHPMSDQNFNKRIRLVVEKLEKGKI